jgi:D-lyxose ketol-isomerase
MKRSLINNTIETGIEFFEKHGFHLPPFAFYSAAEWLRKYKLCEEIFDRQLGWDITSFGTDDFENTGLLLFTLRNGSTKNDKYSRNYAEKIMMVLEKQLTPCHFHWEKSEDIINRGGGNLVIEIWQSNNSKKLSTQSFDVSLNGMVVHCQPGEKIILAPGESICLEPYSAHCFYGESGSGPVMVGEVSSINDDSNDNCFIADQPRFDQIIEDDKIKYFLASDLKGLYKEKNEH